jgi:hypothetical protein
MSGRLRGLHGTMITVQYRFMDANTISDDTTFHRTITAPVLQNPGSMSGFEVPTSWIKPRAAAQLLSSKGAQMTFRGGPLKAVGVQFGFLFRGHEFQVVHVEGDRRHYQVLSAISESPPQAVWAELRSIFDQHRPGTMDILLSLLPGRRR